jgi:hypothetical protein
MASAPAQGSGGVVQDSERALVPLRSELVGTPQSPDGQIDLRLLVAAAFGLAVEAQRRSLDAAGAVAGRLGWPLRVLTRPAVALARGSVAAARHHLDLDGWAARGLAEQRRAQAVAVNAVRTLIAELATAVLDEIDLDEVVARVDLDRIVARVDLNQIAARLDLDAIVGRIDVDAIVSRVDVDAIAGRIDLDAIAGRLDLDAIVARVDLDAIVARVDIPGLTEQVIDEVDLGEIIRESSSTMASETVDALRVQGMRVDGLVSRIVDRILLREGQRQTGPLDRQPRP